MTPLLPSTLRNQRILLLVNGHKSRANYFAARLFEMFGIDILVFSGHTSHLLQPFDVGIASPLKTIYKKKLLQYDLSLNNGMDRVQKNAMEIRIMMIKCLVAALSEAASLENIQSGFRAAGLFPLNPAVPLSSQYAMDSSLRVKFPELCEKIQNGNLVNNHHLNGSNENLKFVYKVEYKIDLPNVDPNFTIARMKYEIVFLYTYSDKWGKILTPIPDLIYEDGNEIKRIHLDEKYC